MNYKLYLKNIRKLKNGIEGLKRIDPERQKMFDDWYNVELIYTSLALGGSTLKREDIARELKIDLNSIRKSLKFP